MGQAQLSPHDETILFKLVEFERSLPREEQSRRFDVKIKIHEWPGKGKAPEAFVRAATTSREIVLNTDLECFRELAAAGYTTGGYLVGAYREGLTTVDSLSVVQLTESALRYYDEKHDFPTRLADERREFVDSRISTVYPEVVAYLKKAYDAIRGEQPEDNWSSVAHDCQGALRSFADAVYKQDYAKKISESFPSSADFEKKLEQTIRANTDKKELRDLLDKLNRYVNARRHDAGTTREEAKRCVLLTYLLLAEIYDLLSLSGAV
jgi:hypothetical protein